MFFTRIIKTTATVTLVTSNLVMEYIDTLV